MAFLDDVLGLNSKSSIGDVQLDAAPRVTHLIEGTVTEHAVESGQDVTDHYRVLPRVVEIEGVVTDTPLSDIPIPGASAVSAVVATLSGDEAPSLEAYNILKGYFEDAEVITINTGLEEYTDMVLTSLSVDKTATTANAIHFRARARRVRFVDTETGSALGLVKAAASPVAQASKSAGKAGTKEANPEQSKSTLAALQDLAAGGSL